MDIGQIPGLAANSNGQVVRKNRIVVYSDEIPRDIRPVLPVRAAVHVKDMILAIGPVRAGTGVFVDLRQDDVVPGLISASREPVAGNMVLVGLEVVAFYDGICPAMTNAIAESHSLAMVNEAVMYAMAAPAIKLYAAATPPGDLAILHLESIDAALNPDRIWKPVVGIMAALSGEEDTVVKCQAPFRIGTAQTQTRNAHAFPLRVDQRHCAERVTSKDRTG